MIAIGGINRMPGPIKINCGPLKYNLDNNAAITAQKIVTMVAPTTMLSQLKIVVHRMNSCGSHSNARIHRRVHTRLAIR